MCTTGSLLWGKFPWIGVIFQRFITLFYAYRNVFSVHINNTTYMLSHNALAKDIICPFTKDVLLIVVLHILAYQSDLVRNTQKDTVFASEAWQSAIHER